MQPILFVFSGLPGVGKTTIARLLAERANAVFLRIDSIERGLLLGGVAYDSLNGLAYLSACKLAVDNLKLGMSVIGDSVNPIALTRQWWREAAAEAGAQLLEIEVICTNSSEHRQRLEGRQTDLLEEQKPSWEAVMCREWEPMPPSALRIDAATVDPTDAVDTIMRAAGLLAPL